MEQQNLGETISPELEAYHNAFLLLARLTGCNSLLDIQQHFLDSYNVTREEVMTSESYNVPRED